MAAHTFTAIIHKENDLYVADCPEVGTVSQGSTIEEAIAKRGILRQAGVAPDLFFKNLR